MSDIRYLTRSLLHHHSRLAFNGQSMMATPLTLTEDSMIEALHHALSSEALRPCTGLSNQWCSSLLQEDPDPSTSALTPEQTHLLETTLAERAKRAAKRAAKQRALELERLGSDTTQASADIEQQQQPAAAAASTQQDLDRLRPAPGYPKQPFYRQLASMLWLWAIEGAQPVRLQTFRCSITRRHSTCCSASIEM